MRRFVLYLAGVFMCLSVTTLLQAQCDLKNSSFNIKKREADGTGCKLTFDFSFQLNNNTGNKIVVVQAWKDDKYPNYWKCSNGASTLNKAPIKSELEANGVAPFLNIAFDVSSNPVTIIDVYGPDNNVPLQTGYTVEADPANLDAQGYFWVTIKDLSVTFPNQSCGAPITLYADVWSSQSSIKSQWTPHCVICGNNFAFNYPEVSARIVSCETPREYQVTIKNINTYQTITSTWITYIDNPPTGYGPEDVQVDEMTDPIIIEPQTTFTSDELQWDGSGVIPTSNASLLVKVITAELENSQLAGAPNGCTPLPVQFRAFSAQRNRQNVALKWETATEQNNRGFYVQRNTKGKWENIAFVFSAADGGNSNALLEYAYKDLNNEKGVSQYRIQQVDMDGKATYSVIRSVRGLEMASQTLVYPNPSDNGKINVVFEDQSAKNVTISDMSGRVVRQFTNAVNNLLIEALEGGMYSIRITDLSSGVSTTEKVIIKKR